MAYVCLTVKRTC